MRRLETLEDHERAVEDALDQNGPYSHNLISMTLGSADRKFGTKAANKLIEKFDLEDLGWSKKEES